MNQTIMAAIIFVFIFSLKAGLQSHQESVLQPAHHPPHKLRLEVNYLPLPVLPILMAEEFATRAAFIHISEDLDALGEAGFCVGVKQEQVEGNLGEEVRGGKGGYDFLASCGS
ncbi:hypothetical protein HBI56_101540 [Parastagonospora nodorum]|nr:hypothetical protein HBH56_030500 [Parastagonospora nodorum]KAH4066549.1 hypothetical protein HBH50_150590 [Parastagonospora nodorum]KAH4089629.1 hypothetical protein HBH48_115690 [Parastagonospora nodorum]KAH4109208.1 hypothetical protein HBH46_039620 [Parastagonospora nodorum]KAH4142015.1 hypothetical protein HBH45_065270 [Parastagonospora nodorum]